MSYLWVFTAISASQLCPSKNGKPRNPTIKGKLIAKSGKIEHRVVSHPGSGLAPEWNFTLFQFPAQQVAKRYDSIKFVIKDKGGEYLGNAKIKWEFIGEPPKDKTYTLRITNQRKKSNSRIGGLLKVHTTFQQISNAPSPIPEIRSNNHNSASPNFRLSRNPHVAAEKLTKKGSLVFQTNIPGVSSPSVTMPAGTKVQFSAAGRREILIPTSGVEKFITFGELPQFDIIEYNPVVFKKKSGGEKFGFSLNNALWLVTCATLAYKDEETVYDVCRNVWDMTSAVFISNVATDTHGFCMHDDRICVICFRGTESLNNWMTNLKFVLIPGNYPERYTQDGMRVHQGFHEALMSVFDQIEDFVTSAYSKFPHLKLYICGHSLGGALANLCLSFFTLTDKPRHVSAVYTIGQPRVGNRKFKQLLEKCSPNTVYIRITNNQDVVPNLAAGQHVGTHVHIDASRRLSFKPPVWKKAMNEITSIQGAGKELQYGGIADHSGPVYRTIVEENWSRYQALQQNSGAGIVGLAETTLLIIDMVTESVKSVRRYKPQFRAVVANTIKLKPLIDATTDYLVLMTEKQQKEAECSLREINTQLAHLHKEIVARRKEKSILQRRSKHEAMLNSKLEDICSVLHRHCNFIDESLTFLNKSFSTDLAQRFGFDIKRYNPNTFDITFNTINFDEISKKALATRRTRDHAAAIAQMLETAEEMIEEGELEMALQFLNKMPETLDVQKYMNDELHATHSFLTAKCHAKLHHHTEAMSALKELSECNAASDDLIQDSAFEELAKKDTKTFNNICCTLRNVKKNRPPPEYMTKLKKNEIDILSSIFDEYDTEADGYLTTNQFNNMIETIGVENLLFQVGWKSPKGVPQIFKIIQTIESEYHGSVNLEVYLNLMSTLLPSETSQIGSSAARRLQNKKKTNTALWDMFSQSQ